MSDLPRARSWPSRAALVAFAVVSVAHLASLAAGAGPAAFATKVLLMPCLAAWVVIRRGPRLVVVALLFSTAGDVLLEYDALFIAGMAAFAAAQACYVSFFLGRGALPALRRRWAIVVAYALVWLGLLALLWPGLGDLRIPVAGYSALLTATAVTSAGFSLRTALGGGLFFVSDALIAAGLADLPRPAMPALWIMATYILAQYLLASGATRR